ncbi:MAG: hypothetical protein D3923_13525, partial [Candidatus Electrothrix sp. AR3]|nr:hypothetical protein [Candidatus Electrothrix sp. AR3]
LKGEEIPLSARIVSVVDVFDALSHARPYKEAWPLERCIASLQGGAGSQFDPVAVAAFLRLVKRWGFAFETAEDKAIQEKRS